MDFIKRTIRFVRVYLFSNPIFFFTYALNFFNPKYVPKIKYHELSSLESLLRSGKSIIRIGDGEVYIMSGGDIGYQVFDKKMQKIFFDMVREYSDKSDYILCLNKLPLEMSNLELRKAGLFHSLLPIKVFYNLYFNKNETYVDQMLFYYNETIPKYLESYFKTKHLIYVTHAGNIQKIKSNKNIPFTNVSYIETAAENAFSQYDDIKDSIRKVTDTHGVDNCIVLAACGPASKPLAYELSKEGIVTVDVGRGIEVAYTDERIDHLICPIANNK